MNDGLKQFLKYALIACVAFNLGYFLALSGQTSQDDYRQPSPVVIPSSPAPVTVPAGSPHFETSKDFHDFGEISQGEKYTTSFPFRNVGTAPLHIEKVEATCGCTAVSSAQTDVEPGGTGTIEVTFDPESRQGPFRKLILVHTNASGSPHQLTIGGTIKPLISLSPERFYYDEVADEPGRLILKAVDGRPFRVLQVAIGMPELRVVELPPGGSTLEHVLEVQLAGAPSSPASAFSIITDHQKLERITVPVLKRPE